MTASPARWRAGAWAIVTAPVSALASLLLASAATHEGRLAAVGVLAAVLAGGAGVLRQRTVAGVSLGVALVALAVLLVRAPDGTVPAGARVRVVFVHGGALSRWSPTALVPEGDQLRLATHLAWWVDPWMTRASAARLRAALDRAYRGIDRDPAYRALGSAMGDAITDTDAGRMFVYEPEHAAGERRPAVVFLHGSGGAWKAFFHGQVAWAAARRFGVVSPSFGFGNWTAPGGLDAVANARRWLRAQPWVDPGAIYLVSLSNGGRAVTRIMATTAAGYQGVVMVSSVIESDVLTRGTLDLSWQQVPVLVIHGARDERIPRGYIDDAVAEMRARWIDVRYALVADEDHYLILTAHERMAHEINAFVDEIEHPAR